MKKTLMLGFLLLIGSLLSAQQTKVTRSLPAFTSIEASGALQLYLRIGETHEVVVVTDKDFQDKVELEVNDGQLEASVDGPMWGNTPEVKLYITVVELRDLELSGACTFESKNTLKGKYLNIDLTGASEIKVVAEVGLLDIESSGASDIQLAGSASKLTLDLTGASSLKGADLTAAKASVEMSGASSASVHVTESLSYDLSGASSLKLKGSPEIEFKEVSGASELSRF